jgi:hypothetical protein
MARLGRLKIGPKKALKILKAFLVLVSIQIQIRFEFRTSFYLNSTTKVLNQFKIKCKWHEMQQANI